MNPFKRIFRPAVFTLTVLAFIAGAQQAIAQTATQPARIITAGSVSGTIGATVTVPITIDNAADIGGIAFTMTYNPATVEFQGLEKATSSGWNVNDSTAFKVPTAQVVNGVTYYNPYIKSDPYPNAAYTTTSNSTLFFQFNDVKGADNTTSLGRVLVAGASAEPLTGTTIFNAIFKIKGGINGTKEPINLLRSIIKNPAAGYTVDTFLPVLVGTGTKDANGKYPTLDLCKTECFPVIPAELKAGAITIIGNTYDIGGLVTYQGGTTAAGCTVVLMREATGGATGITGYLYNSETIAGQDGKYKFSGKPPGNYKILVRSLDPKFNDYESTTPIALSTASITNADATLPLKPQPIYVTGTVTAGNIPGLLVKVVDGSDNVLGIYPVSSTDGKWTSSLLPPLTSGYHWYLVYGSLISAKDATTFDVSQLKSISGKITGLASGKTAEVTAGSVIGKLLKPTTVTQSGTGDVNYTINNLVPASDYVVAVVTAGQPVTYYNATTDITTATKVDISTPDKTGTGIDFTFASLTNHIAGWIKESGNGVTGISVYGFEASTFALVQATTDGSGNFDLSVKPGTYEVFVIKSNGKIFYYYDATGNGTPTQAESSARLVTVATGQSAANININITEADKTLSGKVTYRTATGDPAANVLIAVWNSTQRALALTDQTGSYKITGLVNGVTYNVDMKPLSGNYPVQSTTIVAGTNTTKDFIIDTGAVLSGTVTEENSNLVKKVVGAMIFLKDKTTGALVGGRVYFSDKDGKYSIRDISSGSYTLEVTHPDYKVYTTDIDIGAADVTQDVALSKGAFFKGTVRDGSSNPLAGVTVIAFGADVTVYTVTNINGLYSIYGVDPTKAYVIFAQKRGYERSFQAGKSPTTAGTTVDFTLSLPASTYKVSGTVKTSDNAAVSGAFVFVQSKLKNFFASTQTGTDGTYSISGLVSSTDYGFVVIPPGNLPVQILTNQTINADTTQDFTINLGLTISGKASGPPSGTLVYVFLHKADKYVTFVETTDGNFTFRGLDAGSDYKVLFVAPGSGYTPSWYNGKTGVANADPVSAGNTSVNITLTKP